MKIKRHAFIRPFHLFIFISILISLFPFLFYYFHSCFIISFLILLFPFLFYFFHSFVTISILILLFPFLFHYFHSYLIRPPEGKRRSVQDQRPLERDNVRTVRPQPRERLGQGVALLRRGRSHRGPTTVQRIQVFRRGLQPQCLDGNARDR